MAFDPVSLLLEVGNKVIDRVWPDPAQAAKAKLELVKMQQSGDLAVIAGQMEIDKSRSNKFICVRQWLATLYRLGMWGCLCMELDWFAVGQSHGCLPSNCVCCCAC